MLLHLSALIALLRGLSMSPPRCPCPVFCLYLSVEACLSPSLPFAVFALRLVGCDNVCCSSLVLSITAGSRRFPVVNSQSIYVPFSLVTSKKKCTFWSCKFQKKKLCTFWSCKLQKKNLRPPSSTGRDIANLEGRPLSGGPPSSINWLRITYPDKMREIFARVSGGGGRKVAW